MSIISREDLLNKQKEVQNTISTYTCRVLVCSGTGCMASGAQKIYDEMSKLCSDLDGVRGGDAERYSPSWRGKNRMPGSL